MRNIDAVMLQKFGELWFSLPQEIQSPEKEIREIYALTTLLPIAITILRKLLGKMKSTPIVSEMRF